MDRWSSNRQYEYCASVYKTMKRTILRDDPESPDESFWTVFQRWAMENIDFTKKVQEPPQLWSSMALLVKHFLPHPHLCIKLMSYLFPLRESKVLRTPILRRGMETPVFKTITPDMLTCFSEPMGIRGRGGATWGVGD